MPIAENWKWIQSVNILSKHSAEPLSAYITDPKSKTRHNNVCPPLDFEI